MLRQNEAKASRAYLVDVRVPPGHVKYRRQQRNIDRQQQAGDKGAREEPSAAPLRERARSREDERRDADVEAALGKVQGSPHASVPGIAPQIRGEKGGKHGRRTARPTAVGLDALAERIKKGKDRHCPHDGGE